MCSECVYGLPILNPRRIELKRFGNKISSLHCFFFLFLFLRNNEHISLVFSSRNLILYIKLFEYSLIVEELKNIFLLSKDNRFVDDAVQIFNRKPSMQGCIAANTQDVVELATEKILIIRKINQVESRYRLT